MRSLSDRLWPFEKYVSSPFSTPPLVSSFLRQSRNRVVFKNHMVYDHEAPCVLKKLS